VNGERGACGLALRAESGVRGCRRLALRGRSIEGGNDGTTDRACDDGGGVVLWIASGAEGWGGKGWKGIVRWRPRQGLETRVTLALAAMGWIGTGSVGWGRRGYGKKGEDTNAESRGDEERRRWRRWTSLGSTATQNRPIGGSKRLPKQPGRGGSSNHTERHPTTLE